MLYSKESKRKWQKKKNRKIFYDIDFIGENVKYRNMNKYLNLQLENTRQKMDFNIGQIQ